MLLATIACLLSSIGFTACNGQGTDEASFFRQIERIAPDQNVSFEELKAKVLSSKCLRCHGEFADESGIAPLLVPGRSDISEFYLRVAEGSMPPRGRLQGAEIELFRRYIDGVSVPAAPPSPEPTLPDPVQEPTPAPVEPAALFAELKTKVFESKCLRCHGEFKDEAGIAEIVIPKNADESELFIRVSEGSMPPRGPKLNEEELGLFRNYINALPLPAAE